MHMAHKEQDQALKALRDATGTDPHEWLCSGHTRVGDGDEYLFVHRCGLDRCVYIFITDEDTTTYCFDWT